MLKRNLFRLEVEFEAKILITKYFDKDKCKKEENKILILTAPEKSPVKSNKEIKEIKTLEPNTDNLIILNEKNVKNLDLFFLHNELYRHIIKDLSEIHDDYQIYSEKYDSEREIRIFINSLNPSDINSSYDLTLFIKKEIDFMLTDSKVAKIPFYFSEFHKKNTNKQFDLKKFMEIYVKKLRFKGNEMLVSIIEDEDISNIKAFGHEAYVKKFLEFLTSNCTFSQLDIPNGILKVLDASYFQELEYYYIIKRSIIPEFYRIPLKIPRYEITLEWIDYIYIHSHLELISKQLNVAEIELDDELMNENYSELEKNMLSLANQDDKINHVVFYRHRIDGILMYSLSKEHFCKAIKIIEKNYSKKD